MSCPLISIIVPVYKVEPYLRKCIDSILSQTFTGFELILVNDGSPDSCPEICDEYAKKDSRVQVIHKENGGLSDARNAGIKTARGEYIVFVDSDDMLVGNVCLERLASEINRTRFKLYYLNNSISEIPTSIICKASKIYKRNRFMKGILKNNFKRPCAWAWACSRDFLLENGLYFYKGILHEDEEWLPRLLLALNERDEILVFNDYFYFYRMDRNGSIMSQIRVKNISDRLLVIENIKSFSNHTGGFEKKFLLSRAAQILMGVLIQCKDIYSNDEYIMEAINRKIFLLWKSSKLKHKVYFLFIKLRGGI